MGMDEPLEPTPGAIGATAEPLVAGIQVIRTSISLLDLGEGSLQRGLWGINLYPAEFGTARFVEFDSVINIRPSRGNRTRSVDDAAVRATVTSIVDRLVTR